MTLGEYLEKMAARLSSAGVEDAENEAFVCLQSITGMSSSALRFASSRDISDSISAPVLEDLESAFARREKREPLAYIVGHTPFYDLEFSVGKGVLIPRFDTEILVEAALTSLRVMEMPGIRTDSVPQVTSIRPAKALSPEEPVLVFDLCSGSGCVGITIAHELMKRNIPYKLIMTDISEEAVEYSRQNAEEILGDETSGGNWEVRLADLWPEKELAGDSVSGEGDKADLIVSNPPYVTLSEMAELSPEVKAHEPELALTDQGDGLSMYRRIAKEIKEHLKPGGTVLLEHGSEQGESVRNILRGELSGIITLKDYGGHDRVTAGKKEADT